MNDIPRETIEKAAQGDTQAFEAIYRATAGYVYNVALRVVGKREDAQEVTQEVYVTVYHKLKDFRFGSSLRTWLYRIATNNAINYAKKEARIRDKTVEFDDAEIEAPAEDAGQPGSEGENSSADVDVLLAELPPDQRACIVLRSIEGLSYQEIAETMKININTVRSRLNRARERLLAFRKKVTHG